MYLIRHYILYSLCILLFTPPLFATTTSKIETIIIPLNNWESQRVLSKVVGTLIQQRGEKVEYQKISAHDQWGALRQGLIHLQIEIWQASMSKDFNKMIKHNYIEDMGAHSATGREEWWYPEYIEEKCKGLPHWKAMNDCSHLFAHDPLNNKGIYYTGLWDIGDADKIRALNLQFTITRLPDGKALWTILKEAVAEKRPLVLLNWTPNWTDVRVKGKFIDFPTYTPECKSDPSWGINSSLVNDCGNPKKGWIKKAAWTGLKKQSPCTYQLIKNIDLSNEMIAEASALVIADGHSEEKAVQIWMNKYNKNISSWLNSSCSSSTTQ
jgi:glycine betaine/proline transport system substrate-binding protein